MSKPRIIAIVGPTSSGKSALAVWLAKRIKEEAYGAEVISADSRQVYRGLNIGTGKVTIKETAGVPHHLLDVASPKKQFSADDFVKLGEKAIGQILKHKKIPIIVGGTGLYVDALLGRIVLPNVPPNKKLREQLERKTTEQLFKQLQTLDPVRAKTIEPQHKRRLIRAIEVAKAIGRSPLPSTDKKYDVLWLGLKPSPAVLAKRIHIRLFVRIRSGMLAEAKQLHTRGLSYKRMEELGLEYRSLSYLLQNKITRQEFEVELERAINNYTKRQLRWFERNSDIVWIKNKSEALRFAKKFIVEK